MKPDLTKPANQPINLPEELLKLRNILKPTLLFLSAMAFTLYTNRAIATVPISDTLKQKLEQFETDTAKIKYLNRLAWDVRKQNYDKSMEIAKTAVQLSKSANFTEGYITAQNIMGTLYSYKGQTDKAIRSFYNVLEKCTEEKYLRHKANALNNLGNLNYFLGNYSKTVGFLKDAIAIYQKLEHKQGIASGYKNLGNIYYHLSEYDKAIRYQKKSLDYYRELNDSAGLAGCYHNLANFLYHEKKYSSALLFNKQGLDIYKNLNNKQGILLASLTHSELLLVENRLSEMNECLELAQKQANALGGDFNTATLYKNYAKYDSARGNYENALINYKKFVKLRDSLKNTERINELNELQTKYEVAARERENELQAIMITRQRYAIVALGSAATLLVLIGVLLLHYNIRQKRSAAKIKKQQSIILDKEKELHQTKLGMYKKEIDMKQKELASSALWLIQANEQNKKMMDEFSQLGKKHDETISEAIKRILNKHKLNTDKNFWSDFEVRFKQVHEGFYRNLTEAHPDLSPGEKKLCAFLRLNMRTKEIAAITFSSENGINVARSRLRNKMELEREENLVTYLSKF
ncbi:MAG: tetratricopeptide repeat protein [Salinivirgaceae bacterium]|jgi:tetratricopeptide (TPR) repeat protein|nr:tetratricopeptide repeat protein [Salinivirgaceae bacterium]